MLREIRLNDIPQVVLLWEKMAMSSNFLRHLEFHRNIAANTLLWGMQNEWFMRVSEVNGKIVAFFTGRRLKLYTYPGHIAQEAGVFVDEGYRGQISPRRILAEFEKWAFSDPDCVCVELANFEYWKTKEKYAQVIGHLGFTPIGQTFIKPNPIWAKKVVEK